MFVACLTEKYSFMHDFEITVLWRSVSHVFFVSVALRHVPSSDLSRLILIPYSRNVAVTLLFLSKKNAYYYAVTFLWTIAI